MKKITALFIFLFFNNLNYSFSQELPDAKKPPEGFNEYLVKTGDTLSRIAPTNQWEIIMRINKIDEKHLPLGKTIFIPANIEKATQFFPLATDISEKYKYMRLIYISLEKQFFGTYENGKLIFWGPISSGRKEYKTPPGNYTVLWKAKKYWSKKYGLPMPYAINISSKGYFIHHQSLSGKPASHGCVRLLYNDAKKIFNFAEKNDTVVIE